MLVSSNRVDHCPMADIVINTNLFFSGMDYACDVHVISVDSCSPAERAGVKAGDVIVEVSISQILYCSTCN